MFPGPLDWSKIILTETKKISPIEIAINDVTKKSENLFSVFQKLESIEEGGNKSELSSLLNGIIDSAVNGGTSKYMEAFLTQEYIDNNPENKTFVENLKNALVNQYNLTKMGLEIHEKDLHQHFYGLHHKMVQMFENVKEFVEKYVFLKYYNIIF